jgi:hypothetical protein
LPAALLDCWRFSPAKLGEISSAYLIKDGPGTDKKIIISYEFELEPSGACAVYWKTHRAKRPSRTRLTHDADLAYDIIASRCRRCSASRRCNEISGSRAVIELSAIQGLSSAAISRATYARDYIEAACYISPQTVASKI